MKRKKIIILGSTGSIGCNALDVVRNHPHRFKVFALSAYNNVNILLQQIKEFKPEQVAVSHKIYDQVKDLGKKLKIKIVSVEHDLETLVSHPKVDCVVIGMRGSSALLPFLKALESGKVVAPANKEALIIAGTILQKSAKKNKATIIPIDSEQSAIFQCLQTQDLNELHKIHLTASGGALLRRSSKEFRKLTVDDILKHPRWKMGKKITVDSATLMNKGFEVLEAMSLFGVSVEDINVVIHPEAIIHSLIEMIDGSVLAQLAVTDMRLPIQYALTFPKRFDSFQKRLDLLEIKQLNFEKPDHKRFPSLSLCYEVGRRGETFPAVLNAANEEVVDHFLEGKLQFTQIYPIVEKVVLKHKSSNKLTLKNILAAEEWAREETKSILN